MHRIVKINLNQKLVIALIALGIVCVILSIVSASSVLAILGVAFIFWGAILMYITPTRHVPLSFLNASASSMENIERILITFKAQYKGRYLPPRNLIDNESSLVFVPSTTEQELPNGNEITEGNLFTEKRTGLLLTPPGLDLSKLFEKELGLSFTKLDLAEMQEKVPKLLVDDLAVAEKVEIVVMDNKVIVTLIGNIFSDICGKTQPLTHDLIGCLLGSAIACGLAKVSARPVIIEKEVKNLDRSLRIEYKLMEE